MAVLKNKPQFSIPEEDEDDGKEEEKEGEKEEVKKVKKMDPVEQARYLYKNKRIPFDVDFQLKSELPKDTFIPTETECHKCNGPLITQTKTTNGILFCVEHKITGVTVKTKECSKCNIEYID